MLADATFADAYAPYVSVAADRTGKALVKAAQQWHEQIRFDAVVAIDELSVIPAAVIAEQLNLPGIPPAVAQKSRNKFHMRQAHQAHLAPCPGFSLVTSLEAALTAASNLEFPLILKPTLGAGSEHVYRVDSIAELEAVYPTAQMGIWQSCCAAKELTDFPIGENTLLLETFLDGGEHCVEAVVWDGQVKIGSIADRISLSGKTFDNDLHATPTQLSPAQIDQVREALQLGTAAQGIWRSVVHAEFRFHQDQPYILEIAPRIGGGSLFRMAQISYQYQPLKSTYQIAFGDQPVFTELNRTGKTAIGLSMICPPGQIAALDVPAEVINHPDMFNLKFLKQVQDQIKRPPEGNDVLGYIGVQGDSLEAAVSVAHELYQKIHLTLV